MRPAKSVATPIRALTGAALGAGSFYGLYLNAVGLAAAISYRASRRDAKPGPSGEVTPGVRFRILVPAHNEERLIADTVSSLTALDYPSELFEIHVVADNCSDKTAELARSCGAIVHVRESTAERGKGVALAWLLDQLPEREGNHAIVIIDADTLVDRNFLRAIAEVLEDGAAAVQGLYNVRDAHRGGDIGFRAAALAVRHYARPQGRTALGGSSSLFGNGMAFRESIARSYRWSNGLTEDLDMGLRLLLDGHLVHFASEAIVAAEMPETLDDAEAQNERWEAGRFSVAGSYLRPLLASARRGDHGRRWAYCDAAIDISMPPLTSLLAGSLGAGTVLTLVSPRQQKGMAVGVTALTVGAQFFHVLHALTLADAPPAVWRSLLRTPTQALWKLKLVGRALGRTPDSWIRTNRDKVSVAS